MIQLNDVEKKEKIASEIKSLVEKLNIQIQLANEVFLKIWVHQNDSFDNRRNSAVSVHVSETVSY